MVAMTTSKSILLNVLLICCITLCPSWGFFAHQRINQLAVFTLPADMIWFYKQHVKYISEHAVDPDKRRYADSLEAPRHYLDVENYETHIDSIPRKWEDALKKYGQPYLNKNGTVPWQIQRSYRYLVSAFKNRDLRSILKQSAELGHYIGDAHVPLHTTRNHNGQLTGQTGIHGFWESRLPELFYSQYNFVVGRAYYIDNPLSEAWQIVKTSHNQVDSVLLLEAKLSHRFPEDQKFAFSRRNSVMIKQYSEAYSRAYQQQINGMVERNMRATALSIGSFWYSAWVDAGQPVLTNLSVYPLSGKEKQQEMRQNNLFKIGKLLGREP